MVNKEHLTTKINEMQPTGPENSRKISKIVRRFCISMITKPQRPHKKRSLFATKMILFSMG